jgi:hypothetical protein
MEVKNVQVSGINSEMTNLELFDGKFSFVNDKIIYRIYFDVSDTIIQKWVDEFNLVRSSKPSYSNLNLRVYQFSGVIYLAQNSTNVDKTIEDLPLIQEVVGVVNAAYNDKINANIDDQIQSELNKIKYFNV